MPVVPLATSVPGSFAGSPFNDCFGTTTAAGGTAFNAIAPPRANARTIIPWFWYLAGTTAHTLTFLTVQRTAKVTSQAAASQAVLNLSSIDLPLDGGALANTDFYVVQHQDGTLGAYLFSSSSNLALTLASNLSVIVAKDAPVWLMGTPADHSLRQFRCPASTLLPSPAGTDYRVHVAISNDVNQPVMAYSDNSTAQGWLLGMPFIYGDP